MRYKQEKCFLLVVFLIIIGAVYPLPKNVGAKDHCKDVSLIFARGSGQILNDSKSQKQTFAMHDQLKQRLPKGTTYELIELDYPAVGVGAPEIRNTVDAEWSWAGRLLNGQFNQSVDSGVAELKHQIRLIEDRCEENPDHRIVLGGYSQGAYVIGSTLREMGEKYSDKIAYAGMFGDPKFDGSSFAARGVVKNTHNHPTYGVLETRDEELPMDYYGKADSWCRKGDGVCESSYNNAIFSQENHSDVYQHYEIPLAAQRAVALLKKDFSDVEFDTSKPEVDTSIHGKLDLMFVVDATSSNAIRQDISNLNGGAYRRIPTKQKIIRQARLLSSDLRMGLVGYHDDRMLACGKRLTYQSLHENTLYFSTMLGLLTACGNDRLPNTALLKALSEAWRPDAKKMIIHIAPIRAGSPKGKDDMLTTVIDHAKATGVSIFPINPEHDIGSPEGEVRNLYRRVEQTNGLLFWRNRRTTDNAGLMAKYMLTTMAADRSIYNGQPYREAPGKKLRFNLTGQHGQPTTGKLRYRWYFKGGHNLNATTFIPMASHTYEEEYSGMTKVDILHEKEEHTTLINKFMIPVEISEDHEGPIPPAPPDNMKIEILDSNGFAAKPFNTFAAISLLAENDPVHTIRMNWDAEDDATNGYSVRHKDGSLLGITKPDQTSVIITDIPRSKVDGLRIASLGAADTSTAVGPQRVTDNSEDEEESSESNENDSTKDTTDNKNNSQENNRKNAHMDEGDSSNSNGFAAITDTRRLVHEPGNPSSPSSTNEGVEQKNEDHAMEDQPSEHQPETHMDGGEITNTFLNSVFIKLSLALILLGGIVAAFIIFRK